MAHNCSATDSGHLCAVIFSRYMFVLRKIGLSLLALLAVVSSLAETGKVLMRIDGKEVTDTELEAYYSRSPVRSRETPQRYFNHFLFFKLKVADALSMGWIPCRNSSSNTMC